FDKAWNRISSVQAFTASTQITKFQDNTYTDDQAFPFTTADDVGFGGGFPGVLPFEGKVIRSNGAGGTHIDYHADNDDPGAHDTAFNFFSDSAFDFELFSATMDIELDNNNPTLGFEFHEGGVGSGTLTLFDDLSVSASIPSILSDNGNTTVHTDNAGGANVLNTTSTDVVDTPTVVVP
ncbi:MAG: hypothetical protein ACI9QL_004633, partial [Candidatus Omnitrophota bacterium]